MERHAMPLFTLFFGINMLLTGRHAIPVVSSDRECYGFERAFFTLRRFFTLHPFLLVLRLLWEPVDQPKS